MIIEIGEKSYLSAGINEAQKGNYVDALCLFARCTGYEATVNSIVCTAANGDLGYSADLYKLAKLRFGATHNLLADVLEAGGKELAFLLFYCESDRQAGDFERNDSLISAQKDLLFYYVPTDDQIVISDAPDLDYFGDSAIFSDVKPFYVSGSSEYCEYLRASLERSILDGKEQEARAFEKRLLAEDSTDVATLEAQLSVALFHGKMRKAVQLAKKVADSNQPSAIAVASGVEALNRSKSHDTTTLEKLLDKALTMLPDMHDFDLEDYAELALMRLGEVEKSLQFATELYNSSKSISLEAYKVCTAAFFNAGKMDLACEAVQKLASAVPFDTPVQALKKYVFAHKDDQEHKILDIAPRLSRHFSTPLPVLMEMEDALLTNPGDDLVLDGDVYVLLKCLFGYLKATMLDLKNKMYGKTMMLAQSLLALGTPKDICEFVDFAKRELSAVLFDRDVNASLIAKLIEVGCVDKIRITLDRCDYTLDLASLKGSSEDFFRPFAVTASLQKLSESDVNALKTAYEKVSEVKLPEDVLLSPKMTAYAMLRVAFKDFAESENEQLFEPEEKLLWEFYSGLKVEELI